MVDFFLKLYFREEPGFGMLRTYVVKYFTVNKAKNGFLNSTSSKDSLSLHSDQLILYSKSNVSNTTATRQEVIPKKQ